MQNLTVAITINNEVDVTKIDKFKLNLQIKKFKTEYGLPDYKKIFNIPVADRLPALAKKNIGETIKLITVAITYALEVLNLKRPMTNAQVVDLAETVVDSLNEGDNLSLVDFMLFLQKLTKGEYPELYEGIDQPKFMSRLSIYRDERWEEAKNIYYEKHAQYKEMGDSSRVRENNDNPLDIHLSSMTNKIEQLKDQLKEQKNLNNRLREDF